MNKQCGTEVDVLFDMAVTCPVFHLEMSALKAAAFINTTHHPNVENNGHERWIKN
jgi:hypothetical protein